MKKAICEQKKTLYKCVEIKVVKMFPGLPTSVDTLASMGIIDFDAESYVRGLPPRFIGAPRSYLPLEQPLPYFMPPACNMAMQQQPKHDEFKPQTEKKEELNPAWKKALAVIVAGTLIGLAGLKISKKIKNIQTSANKNVDTAKTKTKSWITAPFRWIKSLFTKKQK